MGMKSWVSTFVLFSMVLMAMVAPTLSIETQNDNMVILSEKVRADKKLLVAMNMELTKTEAEAFWPVYEIYQDELFLLKARTAKLIRDYSDAYQHMTDDTARALIDEYMTLESLALKLRQNYLNKFRKILPEVKVVRYYQIENKIQAVIGYELAANIPLIKGIER